MKPAGPVELWRIEHVSTLGAHILAIRATGTRTRKRRPQTRIEVSASYMASRNTGISFDVDPLLIDGVVGEDAPVVEEGLREAIAGIAAYLRA